MVHVQPEQPRFQVEDTFQGVRATIPGARNAFFTLFLIAWLVGWTSGEWFAIRQLLVPRGASAFLVAWLAMWTIGGLFALAALAWSLAGREIVTVGSSTLEYRVEALGIGLTRIFDVNQVQNLRALPTTQSTVFRTPRVWTTFGAGAGSIAFDYGARTYKLAAALDEVEARLLVTRLSLQIPGSRSEARTPA